MTKGQIMTIWPKFAGFSFKSSILTSFLLAKFTICWEKMKIVFQLGKQNFFNTHCVLLYFYKNIGVRPTSLKIATQKLFQGKSLKCVCLKSLKIYCSVCFCAEKNIYVSETELPNKARSTTIELKSLWGSIWSLLGIQL